MTQSAIMNTSVGRWIGGSLTEKRDTDMDDRPIPADKQQYEIGIAYRKDDPKLPELFRAIAGHAWNEFARDPSAQQKIGQAAQYFPQYPQVLDGFSWKISDGDKPNRKGQVSEHTRGHYVFYFKSSFPIRCANQQNAEIPADQIKRGYFVDVSFTCAGNGETGDRAGVYLNPQFVRLIAFGEEIRGGVSAAEAFANAPVPSQLPPGASAMPVAGNPAAMPAGVPQGQMPGFPQTGAPTGMPASSPPAGMPANGFPPSNNGLPAQPNAFPSNQPGFPVPGVPTTPGPGAPAAFPGGNAPSPTGFPGNPAVQPHPTFANGPGMPGFPGA
ncbi:hypothetical protein [Rhizobium leguminosarum]|uniref:hypothetical protein n=1 Tax=Rhizobium leguminosarum TaxID=384 RepID=UPI001441B2C8|nr:hypothetical protein [Rhizobium leguminosarum]MBY5863282.1 hypothetical protein [Rhizobium leguminosarum]NKM04161.1 hypothetical protein [Rhizobium leguminosarum bv. viciae]